MKKLYLDGNNLTMEEVWDVAHAAPDTVEIEITPDAQQRVLRSQAAVRRFIERGEIVYGITTGFGAFKDCVISPDEVRQLQRNILMSHATGVGEPLPTEAVRAMMLIRANTLAKGFSGIRLETLNLLLRMLERGVHPVVPSQGSLGASGDLAPLAHLSLVLIGEGEAEYGGERLPGGEALRRAGLEPVDLEAKEGLALVNGTTMMAALGILAVIEAENVMSVADIAGALSMEALYATPKALDSRIHAVRPHPRQIESAAYMRKLLDGSTFLRPWNHPDPQDAYTLRCIPQVHGAVRDAVAYARWVLEIELNSATDNPLIFVNDDGSAEAVSGGNFHGEPLAIAMDYMALALTDLGNIAERRLTRLTDEASNRSTLPAFLIKHGGLNSGFMLVQYTAAALTSEDKIMSFPASADTIPTSANTEDHISNGPIAVRKARSILRNLEYIFAIELFAAAQGIDFRREVMPDARMGRGTSVAYRLIRERVPFLEHDSIMYPYIEAVHDLVVSGKLVSSVEEALG